MPTSKKVFQLLEKKETVDYQKDCKNRSECLRALQLILDGEATQEQLQYFNNHIDKCLPCIENYNLEVTIRQLLCDKIEKKCVPSEVVESIRAKIDQTA